LFTSSHSLSPVSNSLVFKHANRKKENRKIQNQVSVKARKMELHARDESSVRDKFRTATNALHDYNVAEQSRVETTRENAH
jgi:hypothetical protein